MKLYRIFSLFVIIVMVLSYASVPSAAVAAAGTRQEGSQAIGKPVPISAQDNLGEGALHVKKIADAVDVNAGDPIGFTLILTNLGQAPLTNVILRDHLDPSVGWTVNHTACTYDEDLGDLYCEFGTLPPGWTINVHISAMSTPAMCGELTNVFVASADQIVPVDAEASINIHCKPNVVIKKTEENPSLLPGETARFSLEVSNIGDGPAEGVMLTDNLPNSAGLSWTIDDSDGGNCQITNFVLSCSFGTLAVNEVRTVVVSSPTTPASCGDINNEAIVSATNEEASKLIDNHDSATITVYCTQLMVEKIADNELVDASNPDPIGFMITVTNIGGYLAQNVVLSDPLPAGVAWSEDSSACSIDSNKVLTCAFGNLAADASASVHITGMSSPAVCGEMNNTATATANNIQGDASDTAKVNIVCEPRLTINKTAEKDLVPAGSPVRFTMTVANVGAGTANNVVLTDPLPSSNQLTWSFSDVTAGGSCEINDGVLTCNFGSLDAGEVASVKVGAISSSETCGYLANIVTAQGSNTIIVTDIAQINVSCGVNVAVEKKAVASVIFAGNLAEFKITVSSNGTATATNVTLEDELPSINGLLWKIKSVSAGSCAITDGTLNCSFGNLAPNQTRVVEISAPTSTAQFCQAGLKRAIENYVTVKATNETGDLYDNGSYDKIEVRCRPDLICENGEYFNDFNTNTPGPAFWSNYLTSRSPNGSQTFLGDFSNEDLMFTYPDETESGHIRIEVSFDLYVIRSWDGNTVISYAKTVGPDHWQFNMLDNNNQATSLVNTSFTNYVEPQFKTFRQAFPLPFPLGDFQAGMGAKQMFTLGYRFAGPRDSIYHFVFTQDHTDPTVRISMKAFGLQYLNDESWGIDNFRLRLICDPFLLEEHSNYIPALSNLVTPSSSLFRTYEVRIEGK